jgi:hypothetical protein
MARLTITLPDAIHSALKEAAARRRRTIGDIIEESLTLYGIKGDERVEEIVARARRSAGLTPKQADALAVRETRAQRAR